MVVILSQHKMSVIAGPRRLAYFWLLAVLCGMVRAHMRFVCPRPESGNSGIKSGPCSAEGNDFEAIYTDITSGPLTLRFEETIFHRGAPTRLTLNKYGDKDSVCMLLDQVPHNENGTMNIGPKCWPSNWPLGGCKSQHYVTVNIPDIECDRCYLQLVSIMTDKYKDSELPCWQENQGTNNCSSYFSCANVKIRPTAIGKGKDIKTCTDYSSNRVGDWPYLPEKDPKFARDYYRRHGIDFTKTGWMQGKEFVGGDATYPFALQSHGPCTPETKYYGASSITSGAVSGALLSLTLSEHHAWVRAVSAGTQKMTAIQLYRKDNLVVALDLPLNGMSSDGFTYDMIVDVKSALHAGYFYDMVRISTKDETTEEKIEQPLNQAITAAIMSGRDHVGEAIFSLHGNAELQYSAIVTSAKTVSSMTLNGPARSGMVGKTILSMSLTNTKNGALTIGSSKKLGLIGLDGLHSGQLYVDVQTEDSNESERTISGQLPSRKPCREGGNTCFSTVLTFGGGDLDLGLKEIDTYGYATFRVSGNSLEYKITLNEMQKSDNVDSVYLTGPNMKDALLYKGKFDNSDMEDKVHIKQGSLASPPADLLADLSLGEVSVTVYTSVYWSEGIYGQLPPISNM